MLETEATSETDAYESAEGNSDDYSELTDRALLRLFETSRNEGAFRTLVERYAPLVLGTCRRGAPTAADADDAFQATFLVLSQSAGKIRKRDALGAWLYGVATRVCLRIRREHSRRAAHELLDLAAQQEDPLDELLARHDETVADEELNALPETLRTPLVLRYLAGKSNADVAEELGITVATLEGRLKRGKQRLRMRLLRRGVTLTTLVMVLKATRVDAAQVPAELVTSVTSICTGAASAAIPTLAGQPTASTHIALQELNAMNTVLASKPLIATFAVSSLAALTVTAQLAFSQGDTASGDNPFALDATANSAESPFDEASTTQLTRENRVEEVDPFAEVTNAFDENLAKADLFDQGSSAGQSQMEMGQDDVFLPAQANTVDLKRRTPSEMRIETTLPKLLTGKGFDFYDAPLNEVIDFLRSVYKIQIVLDRRALDDLGMSGDDPVSVSMRGIKLESALNLMLGQMDLAYTVSDEVLLITSRERAETMLETRAYPIEFLKMRSEEVAKLITSSVAPESWNQTWGVQGLVSKETGDEKAWRTGAGEGSIADHIDGRLIIRQTYRVHREIAELLSQLKQADEHKNGRAGDRY